MCTYIEERREKGLCVSRALIRLEALRVADTLQITDFKASDRWCTRFMKRHEYTLRAPTKVAQVLPQFWADKITEFQRFVIRHRRRNDYRLMCIGNMDETPMYMDMLPRSTVHKKGAKSVVVKSTGHERSRYTVVLACMADGSKLPPMLIFKRKTMPKVKFPKGVLVHVNEKGWMDEDACKLWVRKIWQNRPGGLHRRKSLLVWDRFSAHLTEGVTKAVSATNTDIAVIPGGLTGILLPLDVSLNKPFKDGMRERWTKWMAGEHYTLTPGGNMRAPPLPTMAQWVLESWHDVKDQLW